MLPASAPAGIWTATPPACSRSSRSGWNVSLIAYSAAPMNSSAASAIRRRNQRRGLGELGGSAGRPGFPIRWARAARLTGGRSATAVRRAGASGRRSFSEPDPDSGSGPGAGGGAGLCGGS